MVGEDALDSDRSNASSASLSQLDFDRASLRPKPWSAWFVPCSGLASVRCYRKAWYLGANAEKRPGKRLLSTLLFC